MVRRLAPCSRWRRGLVVEVGVEQGTVSRPAPRPASEAGAFGTRSTAGPGETVVQLEASCPCRPWSRPRPPGGARARGSAQSRRRAPPARRRPRARERAPPSAARQHPRRVARAAGGLELHFPRTYRARLRAWRLRGLVVEVGVELGTASRPAPRPASEAVAEAKLRNFYKFCCHSSTSMEKSQDVSRVLGRELPVNRGSADPQLRGRQASKRWQERPRRRSRRSLPARYLLVL